MVLPSFLDCRNDSQATAALQKLEWREIRRRRFAAGLCPEPPANDDNTPLAQLPLPDDDLVGLALSGGGVRSAAYNLGFLQALREKQFLRYVDYMSSVSGGGYTGGHLTALATSYTKLVDEQPAAGQPSAGPAAAGQVAAPAPAPPPAPARAPRCFYDSAASHLGIGGSQRLDALGYRFRHMGEYLTDYIGFAWRYVIWTIPLVLWSACLLGFLATIAALSWRWFDRPEVRAYLDLLSLGRLGSALYLGDEVPMAFLPSVAIFLLLVAVVLIRWALPEKGRARMRIVVHAMMIAWIASLGVSLAVFLGNGETALGTSSQLLKIQAQFTWPLLIGTLISFLPLLGSRQLLQSGREHAPRWKKIVFHLVISGATFSAAFIMVHLMARENISGYATHRDARLLPEDIKRWPAFLSLLDATPPDDPSAPVSATAAGAVPPLGQASPLGKPTPPFVAGPLVGVFPDEASGPSDKATRPHAKLQQAISDLQEAESELRALFDSLQGRTSWERWQNLPLLTTGGTANVVAIHFRPHENVSSYLDAWHALRTRETEFLDNYVNPTLLCEDEIKDKNKESIRARNLTNRLIELLAIRAATKSATNSSESPSSRQPAELTAALGPVRLKTTAAIVERSATTNVDSSTAKLTVERRKDIEAFLDGKQGELKEVDRLKRMVEGYLLHLTHASTEPNAPLIEQRLTPGERAQLNRLLLECLFPEIIRERTMISTTIVPAQDQAYRWWCLLFWGLGCAVLGLFIDINLLSPFYAYYRDRLRDYFVLTAPQALAAAEPTFSPTRLDLTWDRLSKLAPCRCGAPYPLLLGSTFLLNKVGTHPPESAAPDLGSPPADAYRVHSFLFSPLYCGTSLEGYRKTEDYCGGDLSLVEAMAISGAALTPFMVDNLWFSGLMAAFNLRIGQWLPNPRIDTNKRIRAFPWAIAWELWKSLRPATYARNWQMGLVADGGFHDFFGIEELFLRRCRLIVVSDAGCNNDRYEFGALADVIRSARERHGIEIVDLDDDQAPDLCGVRRVPGENRQHLHHTCMRIIYPPLPGETERSQGLLVYAQMSLTGREQLDLQQFRNQHPNFPDEPITNQMFTHGQIESYRQLGFHVGQAVCRDLTPATGSDARPGWRQVADELLRGYLQEYYGYVHGATGPAGAPPPAARQPTDAPPATARDSSSSHSPAQRERSSATARLLAILQAPWFSGRRAPLADAILQYERDAIVRQRAMQKVNGLLDDDLAETSSPPADDLPLKDLVGLLLACHSRNAGSVRSRFLPGGRQIALRAVQPAAHILSLPEFTPQSADALPRPNPAPQLLALEAAFDEQGAATVADFVIAVKRAYGLSLTVHWNLRGGQQTYRRELSEALLAGDNDRTRELCNNGWQLRPRAPTPTPPPPPPAPVAGLAR
jgi:hypothetical protein